MTLYAFNYGVGSDEVSIHLKSSQYGHHAYSASSKYSALEFAQSGYQHVYQPIDDGQIRAGAWCIKQDRDYWLSKGVLIPLRLRTHAELEHDGETVTTSGKTDIFPYGDPRAAEVETRLLARLAELGEV